MYVHLIVYHTVEQKYLGKSFHLRILAANADPLLSGQAGTGDATMHATIPY